MFNFFLGWSQQASLIYNIFFKYICSFVFCKTTRTSMQSRHWIQLPSQPTIHHFHKPTTNHHSITTTTTSLHKSQKTTINNHNRPSQLPQPNPSNPQPPIPPPQATIIAATTKTQNPTTYNPPSQSPQLKTQKPTTHHPNCHNQNPTTFLFHDRSNPQPPRITNPHMHHLSNPTTTLPKSSQSLQPSHTH